MAPADILELNLTDLSRLIAARELSSSEATRAALARLELLEDKLNAFITVLPEQALAEAKKADEEIARGNYRGPLHGVPVTYQGHVRDGRSAYHRGIKDFGGVGS